MYYDSVSVPIVFVRVSVGFVSLPAFIARVSAALVRLHKGIVLVSGTSVRLFEGVAMLKAEVFCFSLDRIPSGPTIILCELCVLCGVVLYINRRIALRTCASFMPK
jgi:hypothetical protein